MKKKTTTKKTPTAETKTIMKTFLVEVQLHDQSTIDPDEVQMSIEELLKPIDAHDPVVRVVELHEMIFEGRIGTSIYQHKVLFSEEMLKKMDISVSALLVSQK